MMNFAGDNNTPKRQGQGRMTRPRLKITNILCLLLCLDPSQSFLLKKLFSYHSPQVVRLFYKRQQEPALPRRRQSNVQRRRHTDACIHATNFIRATKSPADIYQWLEESWRRSEKEHQRELLQDHTNNNSWVDFNQTNFREELLFPLSFNSTIHPWEHSFLIKEFAYAKAYDAAIFYLDHYSDHSVHCYTSALSALSPKLKLEDALELVKNMKSKGKRPNKFILTALFQYVHGGPETLHLINNLQQQEDHPLLWTTEVYNAAIHACTRGDQHRDSMQLQGDFETAFYLFFKMKKDKNIRPNLQTYTSLFLACGMARQVQAAIDLLNEITINPNNAVWGAALNVCAKAGRPKQALQICQRMEEQQAKFTRRHVGALLATYAKAGDSTTALRILRSLQQQDSTSLMIDDNTSILLKPVPIDTVIVNIVVKACAVADDYENAKQLLDDLKEGKFTTIEHTPRDKRMVSLTPDEFTYNTVLAACANSHHAKSLVKEMRLTRRYRMGQVPPSARTYALAINACKKANDWETAQFLLKDCEHDGIEKNVFMYSAAIWTAVRCGNLVEEALNLLEEMKQSNCKPNLVSYRGILSAVAAGGETDIALQLFTEMKTKYGIMRDKSIFSIMIDALEHRENQANEFSLSSDEYRLRFLESVVDKMDKDEFSVETAGRVLESLICVYGTSGRFNDALRTFNRIRGPTNGPCLRVMMSSCALAKRWKEAISILHTSDIVEDAEGPALLDTRALGFAILACSKSGEWEEALNLLELYGQPREGAIARKNAESVPLSALNSLIASFGRAQRPDLALKLLNEMQSRYGVIPNEISYRGAVIACNQGEHAQRKQISPNTSLESHSTLQWWECSLSLLRRMKEEGLQPDEQTYSSVISSCQSAGKWQRALGVLRAMMIDFENGYCEKLNLFCFNAAISACAKGGAWLEAVEIYYKMLDLGGPVTPNFVTLSSVLIALEDAGQTEMAQTLYEDGVKEKIVQPWTATRALDNLGKERSIQAIDLHHFSSAMARIAIRTVLESLMAEDYHERKKLPSHDRLISTGLVIIVGKGKGSELDHSILSPTVQKILKDEYHIPYIIDPMNEGRLIVKPADLDKFVTKRKSWS